jgi:putative hemolysin
VLPAYRTSATIQLLWRGIADYIGQHSIGALFGCASFPGIDPDAHAEALSCLAHHHLAPAECRPVVKDGVALERLPRGSYDERRALFLLPPLVKGYMRVGAQFGDGAYIDHAFNTVDVCVLMPVEAIAGRYAAGSAWRLEGLEGLMRGVTPRAPIFCQLWRFGFGHGASSPRRRLSTA